MTIKRVKNMTENEEQAAIVSWCRQNGLVAVAVPNGFNLNSAVGFMRANGIGVSAVRTQNAIQMKQLKREGLHTGFPDLIIFGQNHEGFPDILFMENKVKNNKPSDVQVLCHEWLEALGFCVVVSKNSIDAIKKIRKHFGDDQIANRIYLEKRAELFKRKAEIDKEKSKNVHNVPT